MNTISDAEIKNCVLCDPTKASSDKETRCAKCLEKGDIVGNIVWDIVSETVKNYQVGRKTYMLTGLSSTFLEGIARKTPNVAKLPGINEIKIAINPLIDKNLQILPPADKSEKKPIFWRHYNEADLVLFAPTNADRENAIAGLAPVARMDSQTIMDYLSGWLKYIDVRDTVRTYTKSMLQGLRNSQICLDLDMWTEFVMTLKKQSEGSPVDTRIQQSAHALQIPIYGLLNLPPYSKSMESRIPPSKFQSAFKSAWNEVGPYVRLSKPNEEAIDKTEILARLTELENEGNSEFVEAIDATRKLLADSAEIDQNVWLESQKNFCEKVDWKRIGMRIFHAGKRPVSRGLGLQTLEYLKGNFEHDITFADDKLLNSMQNSIPSEPVEREVEFYYRWKERLSHPNPVASSIFKKWQSRLFSKEVIGQDILAVIFNGFEELIKSGVDFLLEADNPGILIRSTQHNKAFYWEGLDEKVLQLFKFEVMSVQMLLSPCITFDIDSCFNVTNNTESTNPKERKVELEFYLVEQDDIKNLKGSNEVIPSNAPRKKVNWQPESKNADAPISLQLLDDLYQIKNAIDSNLDPFSSLRLFAESSGDSSELSTVSLMNTNTFKLEVLDIENGSSNGVVNATNSKLAKIESFVSEAVNSKRLKNEHADEIKSELKMFKESYSQAINSICESPDSAFAGHEIVEQAIAFGRLSTICRNMARDNRSFRKTLLPIIAEIGIFHSDEKEPIAIISAWHPLRIAERKAKIENLSRFIKSILGSKSAQKVDLTVAFEQQASVYECWAFPEVSVINKEILKTVEDVSGYSLLVPANCPSRIQESLEVTTKEAAEKFMEAVDDYLEVYPHQKSNLSTAIFDSESISLPTAIAKQISTRIHKDPDLRCDLIISHREKESMRQIFKKQNVKLQTERLSEAAMGFLSRLRIDVQQNLVKSSDEVNYCDYDLVFLHEIIGQQSTVEWIPEQGETADFKQEFDLDLTHTSRNRVAEGLVEDGGVYLTAPKNSSRSC